MLHPAHRRRLHATLPAVWAVRLERRLLRAARFPWLPTALTLRERFREDQLALTASSLTFTTVLALVPFFTVLLAVFTAFPMFSQMQGQLQRWLVVSLVPDTIARQVLGYLRQFAESARGLGVVGLSFLMVTAFALILTIDRRLNAIWRVRRPRPFAQRLLIYWGVLTLGPVLMGASLSTTSFVLSRSRDVVEAVPGGVRLLLDVAEFVLLSGFLAALYHFVPNTRVDWRHAWAGGIFAGSGIELAKRVLGLYINAVPTYSVLYGAFATLPILLVWIYVAWVIVLLGAVTAAYLPSLIAGVARIGGAHGWQFQLAIEALRQLRVARRAGEAGVTTEALAGALGVDTLQLEPVLQTLAALDWVAPLREEDADAPARNVLLVDPARTRLAPLAERLLLPRSRATDAFWQAGRVGTLTLADVL